MHTNTIDTLEPHETGLEDDFRVPNQTYLPSSYSETLRPVKTNNSLHDHEGCVISNLTTEAHGFPHSVYITILWFNNRQLQALQIPTVMLLHKPIFI